MAESSKSSGKFKQFFGLKSDSDKGSKKKRSKGQKQSATDTDKTEQSLSQIEQRSAVIQGGPRAEDDQNFKQNLTESGQEMSANEVDTSMIDQQSLTEPKNISETATDDSKQRDENGDQDLNESNAKMTLESASKKEKEGGEQNVLESEDQPKTSKKRMMAGLSLRRSKKNSKESPKTTRPAVEEKQEEKAIEGTGEQQTGRNEGDTGEEQAKKDQVKTELAPVATAELDDDDVCQVPPEGVTRKKSTDKVHKGKGLKQLASFGRKKKAGGVTANYRKNSKEVKSTGAEQSQSNKDSTASLDSSHDDKGTTDQAEKSLLETGSHQAYDSKPVKEESEETEKDKDDREKNKQGTKLSAKKSKSFTKKSKKKQPTGEELGTSSERNSVSKDDENSLESSSKEHDKNEEQVTAQSDPQSKSTEAFASHTDEMIPTGPGNIESEESKNTVSATKKQKKESGLRRQVKKFMSPNKDRDKKDGEAKEENEEQCAGKSDSLQPTHEEGLNASEEKDQPSVETENTNTLERKKSHPLSQALKTKTNDKEEEQVSGDSGNKSVAETGDQMENKESQRSNADEPTKITKEQVPQGFDETDPHLDKKEDETAIDKQDQDQAEKPDVVEGEETNEFAGKAEEILENSSAVDAQEETQEQKNSTSGEQRNTQSQDHNTLLEGDGKDETTIEAQEKSEKIMKNVDDEMFASEAKEEASKTEESDVQREKSQEHDEHDTKAAQVEQNSLNTEEGERAISLDENIVGDKAEHSDGEKCTSEEIDETVKPVKRKKSLMEEKSRELKRLKETDDDAQNFSNSKEEKLKHQESEGGKDQGETEHEDGLTSEVYTERQDQASEQGMKSAGNEFTTEEEKASNEENRSYEADTKQAYKQLVTIVTAKDTDASDTDKTPTATEQQDEKGTEVDKDVRAENEQNQDLTNENPDSVRSEEETDAKKSQDPSASIENSATDASKTPREEWIMVNALDIPRGISRQLKPYLLLDERTTTCCTIM